MAPKKDQAIGKSKDAWNTKIHALVDAFCQAIGFVLSPGNRHDMTCAKQTFGSWRPIRLLGDKGYDSGPFRTWLRNRRVKPMIAGKSNLLRKVRHDKRAYRGRNVMERFFGRMKEWSCLAIGRENTA